MGKLAFFTTRELGKPENDRIVIGAFRIGRFEHTKWEDWVITESGTGIRVENLGRAPRFWAYYNPDATPRFSFGLFRYLDDDTSNRLYQAVRSAAEPLQ